MESVLDIYVDGSYSNGQTKWAFIVVEDDAVIHSNSGVITDPVICEGRQVGGEIQAVIEAVKYGLSLCRKVRIFYDYNGLRSWIADIFGETPWRANKEYTKAYRRFVLAHDYWIHDFIKVDAHTGNTWNEAVDKLAGKAK